MSSAILERTSGPAGLRSAAQLGLSATAEPTSGMPFVAGRFAVFNQWTAIDSSVEGRFFEQIDPGAFTRTIRDDRPNMRMLFQHGRDPFIGDRPIAPIDGLGVDGVGAFYFGRLFDTIAGRELAPLLEAGVLGSSFRFRVDRERFDDRPARSDRNPAGMPERTILEATVLELGPVTFPAYPGATAGTSTGAHPPRSQPVARPRMSRDEWLASLLSTPVADTPAEAAARREWVEQIVPIRRRGA